MNRTNYVSGDFKKPVDDRVGDVMILWGSVPFECRCSVCNMSLSTEYLCVHISSELYEESIRPPERQHNRADNYDANILKALTVLVFLISITIGIMAVVS